VRKYIVNLEVFDESSQTWVSYDIPVETENEDEAEGQAIVAAKSGEYGNVADDGVRVNYVEEDEEGNEMVYCQNDPCETEAVETHPVSLGADEVRPKRYCYTCAEAYSSGAQHGEMRAIRDLVRAGLIDAANFLNKRPLTPEQIERIQALPTESEYGGESIENDEEGSDEPDRAETAEPAEDLGG
jgi:hypothetical protein